jgi:hypothetical protein
VAALIDIIAKVQSYIGTLPGISDAPALPPDSLNGPVVSVTFPSSGNFVMLPQGVLKALHELLIELSVAYTDKPSNVATLAPFVEGIPMLLLKKLGTDQWGNTVDAIGKIDYTMGPYKDAGMDRIALRITVHEVKVQTAIQ